MSPTAAPARATVAPARARVIDRPDRLPVERPAPARAGQRAVPLRVSLPRLAWSPWTLAAALVTLVLWVPVLVIARGVLAPAGEAWAHLVRTVLPGYVATSALLAFAAGLLALVVGVGTAWLVTACAFPGRRLFSWALVLPLSVPAYVAAYTYAGMLDVAGPVQRVIRTLFPALADRFLHVEVAGIVPAILIFAATLYPYVYVAARASFLRQSRTALEASRVLGRSATGTFFRIALPLARPALVAGVSLVVLEVLNDYGAVKYLGVTTFTTGIFRAWFSLGDLDAAIRLAAFLLLFVFAVLSLERMQRGRARVSPSSETQRPLEPYRLRGGAAAAAVVACAIPVLFGFAIPVAQLGYWAALTAHRVVDAEFVLLLARSFALALGAAALAVLLALVIAYAARLARTPLVRGLARVAVLGYAVPGAVVAVGVLVPLGALDRALGGAVHALTGSAPGLIIGGTVVALIYAYAVRYLAVAYLPVEAGFERECRGLDEASRCLGVPPLATLRRVGLPLLRGALAGALILVFVDVLRELPLTLVLRPFDFDTLATRAFQLASDEQVAESANAALVLIIAGIPAIIGANRLIGRRGV